MNSDRPVTPPGFAALEGIPADEIATPVLTEAEILTAIRALDALAHTLEIPPADLFTVIGHWWVLSWAALLEGDPKASAVNRAVAVEYTEAIRDTIAALPVVTY